MFNNPRQQMLDRQWDQNTSALAAAVKEEMAKDETLREMIVNQSLKRGDYGRELPDGPNFGNKAAHAVALKVRDDRQLGEIMAVANNEYRGLDIDFSMVDFRGAPLGDTPYRALAHDSNGSWLLKGLLLVSEIERQQVELGIAQVQPTGISEAELI